MSRFYILVKWTAVFLCLLLAAGPVPRAESNDKPKESAEGVKQISAKDAASLIEQNKNNPDFIILDVRTQQEYSEGHIENAINMDVKSESFMEDAGKLDSGKTYIIHCRSGNRSAMAGAQLEELGFINVYDIKGGIVAWEEEGYPVAK